MERRQFSLFEEAIKEKKKIIITVDKLYLFFIIFIITLIASFSLGVEKGKHLNLGKKNMNQQDLKMQNDTPVEEKIAPEKGVPTPSLDSNLSVGEPNKDITKEKPQEEEKSKEEKVFYSIQLASYTQEEIAEIEAKKLKNKGFKPLLLKKGKYLVLCVGKFETKKEARKLLANLKKYYSDCFIRKLKDNQKKERYL